MSILELENWVPWLEDIPLITNTYLPSYIEAIQDINLPNYIESIVNKPLPEIPKELPELPLIDLNIPFFIILKSKFTNKNLINYFYNFKRILILKLRNNNKFLISLILYNILTFIFCLTPFTINFINYLFPFYDISINFNIFTRLITYLEHFKFYIFEIFSEIGNQGRDIDIDKINSSGLISYQDNFNENKTENKTFTNNLDCENFENGENINKSNNNFQNFYKSKKILNYYCNSNYSININLILYSFFKYRTFKRN